MKRMLVQARKERLHAVGSGHGVLRSLAGGENENKDNLLKIKIQIIMESIEKYKSYKIEDLSEIEGGKTVEKTYVNGDPELGLYDKKYFKNECDKPYKIVTNPGFVNWVTGNRHVATYPDCTGGSDYNN